MLPGPKVSVGVPLAPGSTGKERTKSVPLVMLAMVAPRVMPVPVTVWPTARPAVLATVTVVSPNAIELVGVAVEIPPESCTVPLPSLMRLPVPLLMGLLRKRVPVPC